MKPIPLIAALVVGAIAGVLLARAGGGARSADRGDARAPSTPPRHDIPDGPRPSSRTAPTPLPLARRPSGGEPSFDLTRQPAAPPVADPAEPRDVAWAETVEHAIGDFSKANLAELFPSAEWRGVTCHTTFCDSEIVVPAAEDLMLQKAAMLITGVGVRVQREREVLDDGRIVHRTHYLMKLADDDPRRGADEFTTAQRKFAAEFPDRAQAVRDGVKRDRAAPP